MPFSPGAQDQSGQYIANGLQSFGQSLAQGIQKYQANKLHNQMLQGENEGIINALTQNPELAKYLPQEAQPLLDKKLKSGGLSLADSAKLNGYLTAGVKTYQTGKALELQQAQINETLAQAKQREMAARQIESAPQELAALFGGGMPQGQAPAPQQAAMQASMQPTTQAPQIAVPESVQSMMQGGQSQGFAPPPPAGVAQYAPAPQQGAPRAPISALEAMQRYAAMGGRNPNVMAQLNQLATQEREAAAQADKTDKLSVVKMREGDQEVTYDARTGKELARGKVNSPTMAPEDQIKVASETHRINATNDAAVKRLDALSDDAEKAQSKLSAIQRIDALYAQGAQTGFAQKSLTDLASAIGRATGRKDLKLGNQQALNAELARFAVDAADAIKGQGSITENERQMVKDTAASVDNTPEANRALLGVVQKLSARTVELQKLRLQLEDAGKSPAEISRAIEKARASMPLFDPNAPAPQADPAADILKKYGIK